VNWATKRQLRILAFDIENKPGTYGGGDYTFPKVTAIGAQFLDDDEPVAWCLARNKPQKMRRDALAFGKLWDRADIVLGHNIRRHDVKILNGLYTALDEPLLGRKRMIDTYCDQPKMAGISRSLENICARWECPVEKLHMPEHIWEQAYDGIPEAVERMRERVTTDVRMSIWLFHELRRRGLLP
jgi:hypothetical protein